MNLWRWREYYLARTKDVKFAGWDPQHMGLWAAKRSDTLFLYNNTDFFLCGFQTVRHLSSNRLWSYYASVITAMQSAVVCQVLQGHPVHWSSYTIVHWLLHKLQNDNPRQTLMCLSPLKPMGLSVLNTILDYRPDIEQYQMNRTCDWNLQPKEWMFLSKTARIYFL